MSAPFPKIVGPAPPQLYDWAKRVIVYFEQSARGDGSAALVTYTANQIDHVPAAADVGPGRWGVFKNTVSGAVTLAYNDGGTIKKVTLV